MKKHFYKTIVLILMLVHPLFLFGQQWMSMRFEVFGGVGTSNYYGDIGGGTSGNSLSLGDTHPSFTLGARYMILEKVALKTSFIYGSVIGSDEGSKNADRNYSFSTSLFEPSIQGEYYFLSQEKRRGHSIYNRHGLISNFIGFEAYGFAGLGTAFFKVTPKGDLKNVFVDNFGHTAFVLPIGIGCKVTLSNRSSIGLELGRRILSSDYIDGYTSQFSKHNDVYYFGSISYVYRIKTSRTTGWPIFF
ncbi:MAG: DUF6089 family protein [Bacteroidota bacterium]|nr:DUF6089 family protein [Bacteroidota bacterium]MDP4273544.1 DUF6089 family protein [Bacteroidota bacterium]